MVRPAESRPNVNRFMAPERTPGFNCASRSGLRPFNAMFSIWRGFDRPPDGRRIRLDRGRRAVTSTVSVTVPTSSRISSESGMAASSLFDFRMYFLNPTASADNV